ncbi:OmpA family protein [Legionella micdadei]|uniref:Chemotaxis protein MotB n=1 Tax=Legionella micdadei TaxID=451 RepID=A0A098GEM0_LEGMI|nr:OmpA family protein [Legionella micdadei]ARG97958.1 flagellar motor protein MotD [Legionella micdadei]ARG99723.1 flagellar motor protein MotD [Legionella micdadei]KTD30245.1 flagellar motor protein MotD [Legionella micdadei]NSL19213.1 flagellar motor protein MotD [Legionella micdadei]CEG60420.1 Flagellar motor protein [Legionella micdadei]
MRGRKSKNSVPHEDTHRWMVSYADFITLLFAFFVVMYAISSVNVSKYKSLAEGMHSAFTSKGEGQSVSNVAQTTKELKKAVESPINEKDQFNQLIKALSDLQDSDYQMNPRDGWVELDIKAGALFDSGSADLRPIAVVKLMKLASIIKSLPYPIAIEGYTDNMPIDTEQYPSNWELSSARAAAVARTLTSFGVDQKQMSVTGYGEQYPVASNDTEEGRALNRRVNVIIAKDKAVPRLLDPSMSLTNKNPSNEVKAGQTGVSTPGATNTESTNVNNNKEIP